MSATATQHVATDGRKYTIRRNPTGPLALRWALYSDALDGQRIGRYATKRDALIGLEDLAGFARRNEDAGLAAVIADSHALVAEIAAVDAADAAEWDAAADREESIAAFTESMGDAHVLTVVNAVDVPDAIVAQVMALLAPYDPDTYTRSCDADGRTR
jgi:hypothetical protein